MLAGFHLSAMPRQADHRACLELLQNRPLTGAIHMEASQDQLAKWYSAGISNPSRDEVYRFESWRYAKKKKKKKTGRHLGVMTWVWPGPIRVSEVQGRNTCYKGGFFSEDSLLFSSPMSFSLHISHDCPFTYPMKAIVDQVRL